MTLKVNYDYFSGVGGIAGNDDLSAHRLIWHDQDKERDAIKKAIPSVRILTGSQDEETKEKTILGFSDGEFQELAAKAVMALTPQHTYQVLTKRADRLVEWSQRQRARICTELDLMGENFEEAGNNEMVERCIDASVQIISGSWPLPNIWLGVSVENQKAADERIPKLLQVPAAVRFLSCEPLLGAVDLSNFQYEVIGPEGKVHYRRPITDGALRSEALSTKHYSVKGIDWVICGGESGPGARPMHPDWARSLRDQCAAAGMPFFFKQWGDYLPDCQIESAMPGIITKNAAFQFPSPHNKDKMNTYHKLGKKISGRLLDGKEHNEYPKQ